MSLILTAIQTELDALMVQYTDPNVSCSDRDLLLKRIGRLQMTMQAIAPVLPERYYDPFHHRWFIRGTTSLGWGNFHPWPEYDREEEVKRTCTHEWVNISLLTQKLVCKKCDVEYSEPKHGIAII